MASLARPVWPWGRFRHSVAARGLPGKRGLSSARPVSLAELFAAVESPASDLHIIQSTATSPYANLAVEQRLLERSHPASRLLFLYHNAPCVVIGRNQNPWAEVNLPALARASMASPSKTLQTFQAPPVQLVRRRSGGGTVYHDAGNANWSVLGPSAGFDRDIHALMVSRALRRLGVADARVNERHDIVIGSSLSSFKISGSAYKLTRHRSLHHGTCLLAADLAAVSGLLREPPAAPYMVARGVASVRSPVRNIGDRLDPALSASPLSAFADAVADEFAKMYASQHVGAPVRLLVDTTSMAADAAGADTALARGYAELQDPHWLYGQTPLFTFSTEPTAADPRPRPPRPRDVPSAFRFAFSARHGLLQDVSVSGLLYCDATDASSSDADLAVAAALHDRLLYEMADWQRTLVEASPLPLDPAGISAIGAWLDHLLGTAR